MKSQAFIRAAERSKPEHKAFVAKNLDIIEQVQYLLDQKKWTRKMLAQQLGKSESEISKWMSSLHNFTLQSIAKLEAVLGGTILITPIRQQELLFNAVRQHVHQYLEKEFTTFFSHSYSLQKPVLEHRRQAVQWRYEAVTIQKQEPATRSQKKQTEAPVLPIAA